MIILLNVLTLFSLFLIWRNRNKTALKYRSPVLLIITFIAMLIGQTLLGLEKLGVYNNLQDKWGCWVGISSQYIVFPLIFFPYLTRGLRILILFSTAKIKPDE